MMRTSSQNPGSSTHFKVRLRNPQSRSYRQFRQRFALDTINYINDHTETVTHIHDCGCYTFTLFAGKYQTSCFTIDTNTQAMYFQFRLVFGNQRTNFQHVRLQNSTLFAIKVQRIVFQEGTTFRHTLTHEPHRTIQSSRLPIAFCTKAITFHHQTLRSQTRNLIEFAQIIEVSRKALGSLIFQQTTQSDFSLSRIPYFGISFRTRFFQFRIMIILSPIFFDQSFCISVFYGTIINHQIIDRAIIHVIAQSLFGSYLITIGYSHVIHLITEAKDQHILRICPSSADTHPGSNLLLCGFILPMSYDNFTVLTHPGTDMAEFAVAMSRLVQVHEVHIHRIPRNFLIILCMEMQQRLL